MNPSTRRETFAMERERGSSSSMTSLTVPTDAKLLPEILEYVGLLGKSAAAYLRFRATCRWLFAILSPHPRHLPLQPPFLMLPLEPDTGLGSFIDIATTRKHNFSQVSDDTRGRGKCCLGSSFGWLFLTGADFIPFLLNPFTGAEIPLPPLTTIPGFVPYNFLPLFATASQTFAVFSGYLPPPSLKVEEMVNIFVHQAVLSADPTLDQQAATVVVLKSYIAFYTFYCRLGDTSWTQIDISGFPDYSTFDIIPFPERKLCAIIDGNTLVLLDFSCPSVRRTMAQLDFPSCMVTYLVESAGELLLITEHHETTITPYRINKSFRVHKIHLHDLAGDLDGPLQVTRVHSIGDRVLFLGPGHSLSISAQDFPGFRGNCIYYVNAHNMYDATGHAGADFIGVFNLEDCSSEDIFDLSEMDGIAPWRTKATMHWWVSPNLRKEDA